jgi:hypothetical protein
MNKQVLQTNAFKNQTIFLKDKKDVNDLMHALWKQILMLMTFIAGLLCMMGWWTMGVMPDSGVLPPLPCPVSPAKVETSKTRKCSNIKRNGFIT